MSLVASLLPCLDKLDLMEDPRVLDELEEFMVAAARPGHTIGTQALSKLSHVYV